VARYETDDEIRNVSSLALYKRNDQRQMPEQIAKHTKRDKSNAVSPFAVQYIKQ
jgi:hypothetical protein